MMMDYALMSHSTDPPRIRRKDPEERMALQALWKAFGQFRNISPTLSISHAQAFLLVALNEGLSINELGALGGLKQSTISRALLDLAGHGKDYALIDRHAHPEDLRKTVYTLNKKGRAFVRSLLDQYWDHREEVEAHGRLS
jgi:DNA-binding MarR family transcriptional regulator